MKELTALQTPCCGNLGTCR